MLLLLGVRVAKLPQSRFNLFLLAMATANAVGDERRMMLEGLSGPVGRYEGFAVILLGLAPIVAAAIRFVRVRRLISDQDTHDPGRLWRRARALGDAGVIAAYNIYLLLS